MFFFDFQWKSKGFIDFHSSPLILYGFPWILMIFKIFKNPPSRAYWVEASRLMAGHFPIGNVRFGSVSESFIYYFLFFSAFVLCSMSSKLMKLSKIIEFDEIRKFDEIQWFWSNSTTFSDLYNPDDTAPATKTWEMLKMLFTLFRTPRKRAFSAGRNCADHPGWSARGGRVSQFHEILENHEKSWFSMIFNISLLIRCGA